MYWQRLGKCAPREKFFFAIKTHTFARSELKPALEITVKAARGTDQRKFPWGNTIDKSYANYVGSQSFDTGQIVGYYDGSRRGDFQTHSGASPYGVHDMAGNVMEWCQDWYSRDYYSVSPKKNPKGPPTGAYRVVRGGSFFIESQDQRTYLRGAGWPSVQTHRMTGFRCVREPQ